MYQLKLGWKCIMPFFSPKFYNRERQYGFTLNRQSFIFSTSVEMYYYCQKFNTSFLIQVNGRLINLIANLFADFHLKLSSFFYNEKGSMLDILAKEVMRWMKQFIHSLTIFMYLSVMKCIDMLQIFIWFFVPYC